MNDTFDKTKKILGKMSDKLSNALDALGSDDEYYEGHANSLMTKLNQSGTVFHDIAEAKEMIVDFIKEIENE